MQCFQVVQLLSAYLDKQLSNDEHDELETHLKSCEKCQRELYELRHFDGQLQRLVSTTLDRQPPSNTTKQNTEQSQIPVEFLIVAAVTTLLLWVVS